MHHEIRRARVAVVAALTLAAVAAPALSVCYSSPFPACPTGNDPLKSTLLTVAVGETPMAFVDPADRSPRRFVPLKIGRIRVWSGSALLAADFLDIDAKVTSGGERGLLAMAVHPQYLANGYFYLKYTSQGPPAPGDFGDLVIERYTRSSIDPNVADPSSAHVVLVIDHSEAGNHNGGWLAFGPDGYLYISTGDGGNGCDTPIRDAQNPDSLRGKLLRIDIDGDDFPGDPLRNYAIPFDNPYVGAPGADEVWAIGLRNPFRFSFDRDNGDLFIGDVGQDNWEEIDYQAAATPAPVNFGWVCREGCNSSATGASGCSLAGGECSGHTGTACEYPTSSGLWDPILCFSNPGGWASIMGGYRYRGSFVPDHAGRYLFADAAFGQIWRTDPADLTTAACWDGGNGGIYAFAEDRLGELYVVNGVARTVECLHDGNPDGCYWATWGGFFQDDFETGDTARWSSTTP